MKSARDRVLERVSVRGSVDTLVVGAIDGGMTRDELLHMVDTAWSDVENDIRDTEQIERLTTRGKAP